MLFAAGLAVGLLLGAPLAASPLSVRVVDVSGRPVRDAVVTLHPSGSAARAPRLGGRFTVAQKNLLFHPFLTIVPVGADISFPNLDPTKHHVYSFSSARRFELKLFAKDQSRTVHFDTPGVVALGCNIHDQMSAYIVVTDSVWTGRTNAQGMVTFVDAPAVPGQLSVWHPYLRAPGATVQQAVGQAQHSASFSIRLRPPPAMPMSSY
ncbi:MAG: methylamine utilization protein [Sphingomicrobium sp.]